jgi:hypothetical protein
MATARRMRYKDKAELYRAVIERNGVVLEIYGPYQNIGFAKAAVTRNTNGWGRTPGTTGKVQTAVVNWEDVPDATA